MDVWSVATQKYLWNEKRYDRSSDVLWEKFPGQTNSNRAESIPNVSSHPPSSKLYPNLLFFFALFFPQLRPVAAIVKEILEEMKPETFPSRLIAGPVTDSLRIFHG